MTIDEAIALTKLIKACKRSGVALLRRGDLELKFGPGEADKTSVPVTGEAVETPNAEKLKEIEDRSALSDRVDDADEELAHMQVENPSEFEELLVQRELIDGGEEKEDNRGFE